MCRRRCVMTRRTHCDDTNHRVARPKVVTTRWRRPGSAARPREKSMSAHHEGWPWRAMPWTVALFTAIGLVPAAHADSFGEGYDRPGRNERISVGADGGEAD